MDPNGATKAYVFWAGQKMSDAAGAPIFEQSINAAGNDGCIALYGPKDSGVANVGLRSKGSTAALDAVATGISSPARISASGETNIPGDTCQLTINGVTTTNTANQGFGTYTEQDVFFASRAGTTLFANIREYAPPTILFLQPTDSLSATHITKLQKGYAKAVGVKL
jgi:hypothetical protein